ncbi:MAG: arylsulfatase A-like enzyme [Natronomonas sp.]|jgi:arylsulfatase A-like enzyme|uniref:sulfatase n=1 Tax=Natronomonas sp. TaxID=2184060 RepID=UPI003988BA6A
MPPQAGRNVLFVVMDTVRKRHLTPYGYDRPTTPTLERFADEALVYEEAVAQAPWTLPVHASMFTGRYPGEHTATQEAPYLPEDMGTLAQAVSESGYATACYSSNAWITPYTRLTAGFEEQDNFFKALPGDMFSGALASLWQRVNDSDRLRGVADRLVELGNEVHEYLASGEGEASKTPRIIDNTIDFVDDNDEWFAFINLMDAHLPYYPPEEYREEFAPGVDPHAVCQNSKEYNSGARDISDEEFDDIRGLYDAEIRHIDAELDRLFSHLKATDQWEETVVVVCADHGELHGEHGLYGHEFCIYDPLVNVPLMVKHPDIDVGRTDEQVELLDLYDTVLEATGATDATEAVGGRTFEAGRSLLSEGRDIEDGEFAFVDYHRPIVELNQLETKAAEAGIELDENSRFYSRMRAARRPGGKYIRNEHIPDEAYRLDADPEEADPVDSDDPVIEDVLAALERFEARSAGAWDGEAGADADEALSEMDDEAKERLQDLGYME